VSVDSRHFVRDPGISQPRRTPEHTRPDEVIVPYERFTARRDLREQMAAELARPSHRSDVRRGDVMNPPRRATTCPNLNHRRSDAPVGHCPQCGDLVNPQYHVVGCQEERHAAARRQQCMYCVHCGVQLIGVRRL
jgi:hypothetical protein